ncbi:MAG TPA: ParB/RepB/Spo0J family partition protein [Ilumatobacter sp.]|nr:ParB/RepB/Spo0J family partition protein [Ilumatobacter sp.]
MTITEPTTTDTDTAVSGEPELCWLNVCDLAPHPDNPRRSLGDLTELTRSVKAHGVLESLLVLPANDDGTYLVVAGHRRLTAARKAEVADVPAVVRPMTRVEVIETMLTENVQRADLTLSEEVDAIEALMSLDAGLSPAKLCRRIGKSQQWVRSRMTVTILPARWRAALDTGDLSLTAGEAAASAADLGPDHLEAVCERLSRSRYSDPARQVSEYRDGLRRAEAYEQAVAKARAKHPVVFTDDDPPPPQAKRLGELFDAAGIKAHAAEPCHAVVVHRTGWGQGFEVYEVCTDPRRHAPSRVGTAKGSDLATDRTVSRGGGDDSHAKRKGRLARLAHATDTFAKPRGGFSQADLTRVALRGLILSVGYEALGYAATMLGHDQPREATAAKLLDGVDTPAGLIRVAGAVALGQAEAHMYHGSGSTACRDYLAMLNATGLVPDDWTAAVLDRHIRTDAVATDPDDGEGEDNGDGEDDDEVDPSDPSDDDGDLDA